LAPAKNRDFSGKRNSLFYLLDQDPYSMTYTYMNNGNFLNVDAPEEREGLIDRDLVLRRTYFTE
jgi:hypothetical protein